VVYHPNKATDPWTTAIFIIVDSFKISRANTTYLFLAWFKYHYFLSYLSLIKLLIERRKDKSFSKKKD